VSGCTAVRDVETFDMAHATGMNAVVALDPHDHGQHWCIPKDKN
jgi:hypothetical protein